MVQEYLNIQLRTLCAVVLLTLSEQQTSVPSVLVLTTGGTIASVPGQAIMEGSSLVESVPQLNEHADIQTEEISRIDSSNMTPQRWLALAQTINRHFSENPDLAGIVVTHGTDTLEETAYFLTLTVRDRRPVVVTGAMRDASEISADGPANLVNAVRVAASPDAAGRGVLVCMNEEIHSARRIRKTDNRRVQAFRSGELGELGYADPDQVVFCTPTTHRHTMRSEFDVRGIDTLPTVALVSDYTGFDGAILASLAERGIHGIVISSFAGGRMSATAERALADAVDSGVVAAVASRIPRGRIVGAPLGTEPNAALSRELSPQKTRILLMLALTAHEELSDIQRIFDEY